MNPRLDRLHPYPFERLRALTARIVPNPAFRPIGLGIGEPRHPAPAVVEQAIVANLSGLSRYPATAGEPALRASIAGWIARRYDLQLDPATEILPVNGSREALFAIAQTVVDPTRARPTVVCPNPFYQIYEGAALLAGAEVAYVPSEPARNFAVDWAGVSTEVWQRTQLVYVCTPGNPTGAVMSLADWRLLFALSDRHGFAIVSDECYSEIWFDDAAPLGALQAARALGRGFERLLALTSLSKRSNVPGLRSGFAAGDAALLKSFLLYRTYHGSAMSPLVQQASIAAWDDEAHVVENRAKYRAKFEQVTPILARVMPVALPDAGFYLWPKVPPAFDATAHAGHAPDIAFVLGLLAQYNLAVLPGSLLARDVGGFDPGRGRVRLALVAELDECVEAAHRIASFVESSQVSST